MNKIFFVLAVAVVAVIIILSGIVFWQLQGSKRVPQHSDVAAWQTYRSENYGMQFQYPPSYTVTSSTLENPCLSAARTESSCLFALAIGADDNEYAPTASLYLVSGVNAVSVSGQTSKVTFDAQKSKWVLGDGFSSDTILEVWGYTDPGNEIIKALVGASHGGGDTYIVPDYANNIVAIFSIPTSRRLRCELVEGASERAACEAFHRSAIDAYGAEAGSDEGWLPSGYFKALFGDAEKMISTLRFGRSDESFIQVTSPNGGEEWTVGDSYAITWEASGVNALDIGYRREGSGAEITGWIQKNVPASQGRVSWVIPEEVFSAPEYVQGSFLVRIGESPFQPGANRDGTVEDMSDALFTIKRKTGSSRLDASAWKTYPNQEFGFALQYPQDILYEPEQRPNVPILQSFSTTPIEGSISYDLDIYARNIEVAPLEDARASVKDLPASLQGTGPLEEYIGGSRAYVTTGSLYGGAEGTWTNYYFSNFLLTFSYADNTAKDRFGYLEEQILSTLR